MVFLGGDGGGVDNRTRVVRGAPDAVGKGMPLKDLDVAARGSTRGFSSCLSVSGECE